MKIKAVLVAMGVIAGMIAGPAANATIVKSTIAISVPAQVNASVANPVDVSVCALASSTAKTCEVTDERNVTLFVNGKIAGAMTTTYGVATFYWAPAKAGKFQVSAKVTAKGTLKALTSESKSVVVGKKVASSKLTYSSCTSDGCSDGAPESIAFDDESATLNVLTGTSSLTAKGRALKLQFVNTSNQWTDQAKGTAVWMADQNSYGYTFSLTQDSTEYCVNGDEVYTWTYRAIVLGNASASTAVTDNFSLKYDCGGTSSGSSISVTVDYGDQSIDSSFAEPDQVTVSIDDPDYVGYSATTQYCETGCSLEKNWFDIDSVTDSGPNDFYLSGDWGNGTGTYNLRVVVDGDDSSQWISDSFAVDIY